MTGKTRLTSLGGAGLIALAMALAMPAFAQQANSPLCIRIRALGSGRLEDALSANIFARV